MSAIHTVNYSAPFLTDVAEGAPQPSIPRRLLCAWTGGHSQTIGLAMIQEKPWGLRLQCERCGYRSKWLRINETVQVVR